jgi:hypothetical protein
MSLYRIASTASIGPHGIEVIIKGPGIGLTGLRRWFPSRDEADDFVDAMNMAFDQGRRKAPETMPVGEVTKSVSGNDP